jgi:starch phosphorylase
LHDFASYCAAQQKANDLYKQPHKWAESAIINVAASGKFSSDRTIEQYVEDIWGLKKVIID